VDEAGDGRLDLCHEHVPTGGRREEAAEHVRLAGALLSLRQLVDLVAQERAERREHRLECRAADVLEGGYVGLLNGSDAESVASRTLHSYHANAVGAFGLEGACRMELRFEH
jgi:hypothetical protein